MKNGNKKGDELGLFEFISEIASNEKSSPRSDIVKITNISLITKSKDIYNSHLRETKDANIKPHISVNNKKNVFDFVLSGSKDDCSLLEVIKTENSKDDAVKSNFNCEIKEEGSSILIRYNKKKKK